MRVADLLRGSKVNSSRISKRRHASHDTSGGLFAQDTQQHCAQPAACRNCRRFVVQVSTGGVRANHSAAVDATAAACK
eukprot:SAG11_NODE_5020_length_1689_cov_2.012579_2_plen_78_part_00